MSYQISLIQPTGYIGDDISDFNQNYENFETLTLELINSAANRFDPLMNFYSFYSDFWKSTIKFSDDINAKKRLTELTTQVTQNSAMWVNPLVFYYPAITKYDVNNLSKIKTSARDWFISNYPITNINGTVNFVENTKALIYCLFYEEKLKIDTAYNQVEQTVCTTRNSTASVNCWVQWLKEIACYDAKNACTRYDKTQAANPTSPSCVRNFTLSCKFENGQTTITRSGILNVNSYFSDRYEKSELLCIRLNVKNCEWVDIDVI